MSDPRLWIYLVVVILVAVINIWVAHRSASGNKTWLQLLNRPKLEQHVWILAFIKLIVYLLILISGYLVIMKVQDPADKLLIQNILIVQLGIKLAWIIIFYYTHNFLASYYLAVMLFILNLGITMFFGRVYPLAGWLYFPYFVWTGYILSLSHTILITNKHHHDSISIPPFSD